MKKTISEFWIKGTSKLCLKGTVDSGFEGFNDELNLFRERMNFLRNGWQPLNDIVKRNNFDMRLILKI